MTRNRKKATSSPNLPIFMYKAKILESIEAHQVVIITGQTGCGKSTQVPKYLLESGYGRNGIIACLHPRCVAAMSLAERVSKELNKGIGDLVGYQVRFYNMKSDETKILFMTTGFMLMMMRDSKLLNKYSVVVIDEAHERSVQTDIMMGLMKEIIKQDKRIKLIIMSATLDVTQIKDYYENCAVVQISNKIDKVKVIYRPLSSENYIAAIKVIVEEILKNSKKGHILIFLQSEEKVIKCKNSLKNLNLTKSLPFFASMDQDEKERVFLEFPKRRKIIVATNVAETSLTIPGVDFVIDSGLVKRIHFDYETGVEKWMTKYISIAEADQRKGRTGRTGIGTCYRLYNEKCVKSELIDDLITTLENINISNVDSSKVTNQLFPAKKDFKPYVERFKNFPEPEITTVNLSSMTLILKSMNRKNIMDFPFIVPPDEIKVKISLNELKDLSLLDEQEHVTKIGKIAGKLPLEPRLGKVATIATELSCSQDVNKIIAMLCVRHVLKSPLKYKNIHSQFASEHGDLFQLLNIFDEAYQNNFAGWWCENNAIDRSCLKYAYKVFCQLQGILYNVYKANTGFYNENTVKKAFLSGFFHNIARKSDEGVKYLSVHDKVLSVSNVSCLDKLEKIILFQSIQKPSEVDEIIIRNCTSLNKQMLMNLKTKKLKIKTSLWKSIIEKQLQS